MIRTITRTSTTTYRDGNGPDVVVATCVETWLEHVDVPAEPEPAVEDPGTDWLDKIISRER